MRDVPSSGSGPLPSRAAAGSPDDRLDIARRFFAALAAGDPRAAARDIEPDAVLWQNHDRAEKPLADRVASIGRVVAAIERFTYADARIDRTTAGVLVRHVLIARFGADQEVAVPMIVHLTFEGNRITRADEYLDSGQMAPLAAFLRTVIPRG